MACAAPSLPPPQSSAIPPCPHPPCSSPVSTPSSPHPTPQTTSNPSTRQLFPYYQPPTPTRVRFANKTSINLIPPLTTPEEWGGYDVAKDVWWEDADYRTFREVGLLLARPTASGCGLQRKDVENFNSSLDMSKGKWWCAYGHSRRGLEHVSDPSNGYMRHEGVRRHINSVLEEQGRQRFRGVRDDRLLGVVSRRGSEDARNRGRREGGKDEDIAKKVRAEWAVMEGRIKRNDVAGDTEEENGGQQRWAVGGKKVVEINMGRKDSVQNLRDSGMIVRGKSWDEKVWNGGLGGVTT